MLLGVCCRSLRMLGWLAAGGVLLALSAGAVQAEQAEAGRNGAAATSAGSAETRRYVPVRVRRGQHALPVLTGEVVPRAGEVHEAAPRPSEYVPATPLGNWDDSADADTEVD